MKRLAILMALAGVLSWPIGAAPASALAQETKGEETKAKAEAGHDEAKAKAEPAEAHPPETPAAEDHGQAKGGSEPHAGAESHAGDVHGGGESHDAGGGHDAHAHDPHDLSHANATAQLRAAQELRMDLGIATFLVFLLLLGILAKFAWGPIAAALERREETIAKQIEEARRASELATKQLQDYERKLTAATEEARAIVTQAKNDAVVAKDRIVAEAQEAAQKERERAVADIASAKNEALREIAAQSVQTAVQLATNIIRREVKPEDHDRLIGESLQQFSKLN
jgi:F-type H+-transporting ATPase subunit b